MRLSPRMVVDVQNASSIDGSMGNAVLS